MGSPLAVQFPLCRGPIGHGALLSRALPTDRPGQSSILLNTTIYTWLTTNPRTCLPFENWIDEEPGE